MTSPDHGRDVNAIQWRPWQAETFALYLAARDPRTSWYARLVVAAIVAYALSPIDLIPDFIPVVGYLDDLILVPIGIALAIRLVPESVLVECRAQAQATFQSGQPVSWAAGAIVVSIWIVVAGALIWWMFGIASGDRWLWHGY